MTPSSRIIVGLLSAGFLLGGCASRSEAIFQAVKVVISPDDAVTAKALNPGLRYLRISIENRVVLLVLGNIEPHPQGATEVWYSAMGEIIRLRDGRIVATSGLATDWRRVDYVGLPGWGGIGEKTIAYQRTRDEMPGYRMGIDESMTIRGIAPPSASRLVGLDAGGLRWFEERVRSDGGDALPLARYAIDASDGRVVYGEQCLTGKLCLAWQRWPVASPR